MCDISSQLKEKLMGKSRENRKYASEIIKIREFDTCPRDVGYIVLPIVNGFCSGQERLGFHQLLFIKDDRLFSQVLNYP